MMHSSTRAAQAPAIKAFESFDEARLREMSPNGSLRTFPRKTVVVNEGDLTDSLYVVMSGSVKIYMSDAKGKEVIVAVIRAGDYFGEVVLDGGPRSASVATLENCRLFVIPQGDVRGLVERNAEFANDLILRLISRVRSLADTVRSLALKDVYGRLVDFLESQAIEEGGTRVVHDRLTQNELAARIGASREMVSRILKDLGAGGYISVAGKQITLHRKLPARW